MRNIQQYPVTEAEVNTILDNAIAQYTGIIGGPHAYVLECVKTVLNTRIDKDLTVMDLVLEEASV